MSLNHDNKIENPLPYWYMVGSLRSNTFGIFRRKLRKFLHIFRNISHEIHRTSTLSSFHVHTPTRTNPSRSKFRNVANIAWYICDHEYSQREFFHIVLCSVPENYDTIMKEQNKLSYINNSIKYKTSTPSLWT